MSEMQTILAVFADDGNTGREFTDTEARIVAGWWNAGQSSALYSFTSCGNVTVDAIREARKAHGEVSEVMFEFPEFEKRALRELIAYFALRLGSQNGPQKDWNERTAY